MKKTKQTTIRLIVALFMLFNISLVIATTNSTEVYAKPPAACSTNRFLTFPAWYRGITNADCEIKNPTAGAGKDTAGGLSKFIWTIVLNIIEIALQIIAYAAAGYIIFGGFKYLTSTGSPDKTVAARKTIIHALVGLVLSFMSIAIVNLIVGNIT